VKNRKPREIACAILDRADERGVHLDTLLAEALPGLEPVDRGLCQEIVCGVTRRRAVLDWVIARQTKGRRQQAAVINLLRVGLYQLLWLQRVPDHAVVYEAVELARDRGLASQSGFVNALLRTCAREREVLRREIEALGKTDPVLAGSHPPWLAKRWTGRWGAASCQQLMDWNNRPAETFARVNTLQVDAGKLLDRWRMKENVEYDFLRMDWIAENLIFRLRSHPPITELRSFREGWFYVQDPSTLLAVSMLEPRPNERILDLCAAPGGKATLIAQLLANQAQVVARDNSPARLAMVRENCDRLGTTCVTIELAKSPDPVAAPATRFDRVLVDAPCSNTGVLRRRVDARWRLQPPDLPRLAKVQLQLLREGVDWLRPDGILVYSTCSLEPEENQEVVRNFLADHPKFALEQEREILPFQDGVDGAYVARLRRAAP
jgi:16S rRNA (cytosine967-C5)-methyltransferase